MISADVLDLEVKIQDLPKGNITVDSLKVGSKANLTVRMEIYPPPRKEDYEWVIVDKSTKKKIVEVTPGKVFR